MNSCRFCKYWHTQDNLVTALVGKCRRMPPQVINELQTMFPQTQSSTLCGEFSLDAEREKLIADTIAEREVAERDLAKLVDNARLAAEAQTRESQMQGSVNVQVPAQQLDAPTGAPPVQPPVLTVARAKEFAMRRAASRPQ